MVTSKINAVGNPVMDLHPIQGEVEMLPSTWPNAGFFLTDKGHLFKDEISCNS